MLIDIIAVKFSEHGKIYLYKAPVGTGLKRGDRVTLQDTNDIGVVYEALTPINEEDSPTLNVIRAVMQDERVPTKWVNGFVVIRPLERDEPL